MNRLNRLPVPTDRAMRVMKWVLIVAVAVFVAWLLTGMARLGQTAESNAQALQVAEQERDALGQRVDEQGRTIDKQASGLGTANKRLKSAGEKPVTIPDQPVSVPKVDGQVVLTSDDVLTLIEAEVKVQHPDLTDTQKRALTDSAAIKAAARIPTPRDGTDGPSLDDLRPIIRAEVAKIPTPADGSDGRDGSTPNAADVAAAITTLCGGTCVGPEGKQGPPGAASTVPGPEGKPGRDGLDSTTPGPAGKDGRDGTNGRDGRGITAITCETDGAWVFTFSDGTTTSVAGPCRVVAPGPEPTPEPTPTETPAP